MRQLACGGFINSNTGPLGHTSSNDMALSRVIRKEKMWLGGVTEAIATLLEHERW